MKKTIGELIDSLAITNNKIFYLVNAINTYFKERQDIKV